MNLGLAAPFSCDRAWFGTLTLQPAVNVPPPARALWTLPDEQRLLDLQAFLGIPTEDLREEIAKGQFVSACESRAVSWCAAELGQ